MPTFVILQDTKTPRSPVVRISAKVILCGADGGLVLMPCSANVLFYPDRSASPRIS